ncbi:MAG: FHA domain-containing protein [Deltaproteobacteria bacterium]|nr:FHA domain-containing protein [Deltaproteobacteria bacterium]
MAALRLYRDGRLVETLVLDDSTRIVGRAADCDLLLISPAASRQHFTIRPNPQGKGHLLVDLDSDNGTFVSGVREYTRPMLKREIIQVGDEVILYEPEAVAAKRRASSQLPKWAVTTLRGIDRPSREAGNVTNAIPPAVQRRIQAERRTRLQPHLVLEDAHDEQAFALDADVVAIGLGPVRIQVGPGKKNEATVLAEVVRGRGQSFTVRAKGLFAKVQVNGESVAKHDLKPGDQIAINGKTLRFEPGIGQT